MNSMFQEYFPITEPEGVAQSLAPFFPEYQALRGQLTAILTDASIGRLSNVPLDSRGERAKLPGPARSHPATVAGTPALLVLLPQKI